MSDERFYDSRTIEQKKWMTKGTDHSQESSLNIIFSIGYRVTSDKLNFGILFQKHHCPILHSSNFKLIK